MTLQLFGFDPGGRGGFGWCHAEGGKRLPLVILKSGVAPNAQGAVEAALAGLERELPAAAGIDAPLVWTLGEGRRVDGFLRSNVRVGGCKTASGTVQAVNSLRAACLVQGYLTMRILRERYPALGLTESHPKAMLWLLRPTPADREIAPHFRQVRESEAWRRGEVPPELWSFMLELIYTGHADSAWRFLEMAWLPSQKFRKDFLAELSKSPYSDAIKALNGVQGDWY